jgi:hypothetical protein
MRRVARQKGALEVEVEVEVGVGVQWVVVVVQEGVAGDLVVAVVVPGK